MTGRGTIDPSPGTHTYKNGDDVLLTATPAQGYVFSCWLLQDGTQITNSTTTLMLIHDQSAVAVFTRVEAQPKPHLTSLSIYVVFVVSVLIISCMIIVVARVVRARREGSVDDYPALVAAKMCEAR